MSKVEANAHETTHKRKCASCVMCGVQLAHGEPRLQQWSNRYFQRAYVEAQCVNVRVGHDHEILPKHPNLGPVENVVQMRNCII